MCGIVVKIRNFLAIGSQLNISFVASLNYKCAQQLVCHRKENRNYIKKIETRCSCTNYIHIDIEIDNDTVAKTTTSQTPGKKKKDIRSCSEVQLK